MWCPGDPTWLSQLWLPTHLGHGGWRGPWRDKACTRVAVTAQPLMAKASGRTSSPDRGYTQSITRDFCTALTRQRRPAQPAPLPARPTAPRDGGRSLQQAGQQAGCEHSRSCPWAPLPRAAAGSRGGRMRRGSGWWWHMQHRGFHQPSPPAPPALPGIASTGTLVSSPEQGGGCSTEAVRGLPSIRPGPLDATTSVRPWHPPGPAVPSPAEPVASKSHGEGLSRCW